MSVTLRNYIHYLKSISAIKDEKIRNAVLKTVRNDKEFNKAIKEITKNTVKGNVPLSRKQKLFLRKYKTPITKIAKSKTCKSCSKYLYQIGGALPILIPTIISILGSLLSK